MEKPTAHDDDSGDESKRPMGIMMNSEGEWVVAEPDQAAFGRFQAKAKASAAANEAATRGSKELQEKGLECPIDQRLFVEPTRTPCCQTVYCHECITNSLLENDLRCPSCSTENILIDDLKVDDDLMKKVRVYEEEQQTHPATNGENVETVVKPEAEDQASPLRLASVPLVAKSREASPTSNTSESRGKKRPAENDIANTRTPPPPTMSKSVSAQGIKKESVQAASPSDSKAPTTQGVPQGPAAATSVAANNTMLPGSNGMMGFPMSMAPNMPMMPGMLDPMMMMQYMNGGNNGAWNNNMWNPAFQQQMMMTMGGPFPNNAFNDPNMMMGNGAFNQQSSMQSPIGNNGMGGNRNQSFPRGSHPYQQRHNYGPHQQHQQQGGSNNEEDGAYFRKPVNPHRHQARRNINRPADYREI